ncbi:MAG: hypothetical protein ABDH31_02935 [Chlorobiota bacterium]
MIKHWWAKVANVANRAWELQGNRGTRAWDGRTGDYIGHSDKQPLVIATTNETNPQPIQLWAGNRQVLQLNPPGNVAPAWSIQRDAGGDPRGLGAVDLQAAREDAAQVASGAYSVVSGGYQNTASGYASTVGGGAQNIASGLLYSTVGGGWENSASGHSSTISGGRKNTASGQASTVGGGAQNTASGYASTVGGGFGNTASGFYSTIGGGFGNTASGDWSTVGGGLHNTASGEHSVVVGGRGNTANADYVMVFGENVSPKENASHRVYLFGGERKSPSGQVIINRHDNPDDHPLIVGTNTTNGNGAHLTAGGMWTNTCSRAAKDRFVALDPQEVLAKIRRLPVEGWYYRGTEEYHIGPYAEDFHEAFGTGALNSSDVRTSLAASDVAGVALLGIKALAEQVERGGAVVQSTQKELEALRRENAVLRKKTTALEQRVAALERLVQELS